MVRTVPLFQISQGEAIADTCRYLGTEHVIYSTQLSVVQTTGMRARHMDAKAQVRTKRMRKIRSENYRRKEKERQRKD